MIETPLLLFLFWLAFFIVVLPLWTYIAARVRQISRKELIVVASCSAAIPLAIGLFCLIASYFDIGLDYQPLYDRYLNGVEFFIAHDKARRPYVITIFTLVLAQFIVTLVMSLEFKRKKIFAFSMGFAGIHFSVLFAYLLLNILLGEWPRS